MPSTLNTSRPARLPSEAAAQAPNPGRPHQRPAGPGTQALSTLGLTVVLVGVLLPMLDFFIVNVALPTIDADLHASQPLLELVVSGYATASAGSGCS
jgi:hypothetical protein